MIHLPHWVPVHLFRPLAWALVHSLWQVGLIVGLYRSFSLLTRGGSPRLRYRVGWLALAACLTAPIATTALLTLPARQGVAAVEVPAEALVSEADTSGREAGVEVGALDGLLGKGIVGVDRQAVGLVLAWLVGVLLALGMLARGWIGAARLAVDGVGPTRRPELRLLGRLRRRMGIRRPVRLYRSRRVDSPLLVGWMRPTILLPDSDQLLDEETLEPVLAHELAHVRRHDYGANLLQAIVGCAFFFHPAFRWLSGRIRAEREACCDDLAARCCAGGAPGYVRGLAKLELNRHRVPALGAAEGDLLQRIQRLIEPGDCPRRRPVPALLLAAACLVGAGFSGGLVERSGAATVIGGLDPVHLVEGRRVAGSPALAVELGGYRYLFTDSESRNRFLAQPHRYEVRNVAVCPVSGRRVLPGIFRVVDGQIVLFCCPEVSDRPFELRRIRAMLAAFDVPTD